MQSFIIIFLVFLFTGSVQPQNWLGAYTPGSTCPTSSCCCLTGTTVVTSPSACFLSFSTGLSGSLPCLFQSSYANSISTPSGFVATLSLGSYIITFILSSNSQSINVTSTQGSQCQTSLTKTVNTTTTNTCTASTSSTAAAATTTSTSSAAVGLINTIPPSKNGLLYIMTFIGLTKSVWSMWKFQNWFF